MKKLGIIFFTILLSIGCQKKENQSVRTIIEEEQNILIGINYPVTKSKKLNKIIQKEVHTQYNSFKEKYMNFNSLNQKSELNIDYSFDKVKEYDIVTIHTYLNSSKFYQPQNYIKTYVYHKKKKRLISLKDVIPKEDLSYITKYVKHILQQKYNISNKNIQKYIKNNHSTYSNFTFDQDYLYLYFDQFQNIKNIIKIQIPLENLNPKIDTEQQIIKTANTKVKIPNKILDPNKKFIALTFDDGPSIYTKEVINILKKYNCNATFFVLGNKVEIYQETIRESLKNGNELGNHSYSHKWLIKLDEESLKEQIDKTQDIIQETTGYTPKLLRPTYGSVNQKIRNLDQFEIILWNVDTLDWKYKSIDRIVNRATRNPKDGNIILMHDIHQRTVKALDKIIPILQNQGFELITISEMKEIQLLRDKMKTD